MNIRGMIMMGFLLMGIAVSIQAQSYERLWEKVEELEKKDLPKSVVEEARIIYAKAEKEKNVPQMMKAFLTMTAYRNEISPDSLQIDLLKLETWADSPQTPLPDKAVLNSILGEMVLTKGMETLPEDIDKACEYLKKSLQDSLALAGFDAAKYFPFVISGETSSRYFNDNLYELLAERAISIWRKNSWRRRNMDGYIRQTYQSLLDIYQKKGMREAWLLTALDAYPNATNETLQAWIKEYGDLDICAEVYLALANSSRTTTKEKLALLREAIVRYPHYERIQALKDCENRTLCPHLSVSFDSPYPNEMFAMKVSSYNLSGFSTQLYQLELESNSSLLSKVNAENVSEYGSLIKEEHYALELSDDYEYKKVELPMKAPVAGIYFMKTVPDGRPDAAGGKLMCVSALQMIYRSTLDHEIEIVVLDRWSGHPVAGASVSLYDKRENDYVLKKEFITDASGKVFLPEGAKNVYCQARLGNDRFMPIVRLWLGRSHYETALEMEEKIRLFTDRAIYRPGQLVQYSGIVYAQRGDAVQVMEDCPLTVGLFDANRQEIDSESVSSDMFGSFHGAFVLPDNGPAGEYRIQTKGSSVTIRVEEYKRPTFEVEFESLDSVGQILQKGDSICLKGWARSFSGAPIQGASVKYTIVGRINRLGSDWGTEQERIIGETVTDEKGNFKLPVKLVSHGIGHRLYNCIYEVSADVTNLAGETQSGRETVSLGSQLLRISVDDWNGETFVREKKKILRFSVTNQLHQPVDTMVVYRIYATENDGNGKPVKKDCLLKEEAVSNHSFVPEKLYELPSGRYILEAVVKGEVNEDIREEFSFVLFSLSDKRMPCQTNIWHYQENKEFAEDHPVAIYLGSSEKNVYLFYDVFANGKHLERKNLLLSDSLLVFPFSYKEEYGDGIRVSFAFMKKGEFCRRNVTIVKPEPKKKLEIVWKTFRDKLQPGEKEKWILKVAHKDGSPADAQLLASMYDASLDQFVSHRWNLGLSFRRTIPSVYWETNVLGRYYWLADFPMKRLEVPAWEYSSLDMPEIVSSGKEMLIFTSMGNASVERVMKNVSYSKADEAIELDAESTIEESLRNSENLDIRHNFAETAFFYPQLRTDAKGEVCIEFTLPESLTTWKFMGLAHTREMEYGELSASVTASKDFMLQPHLPRFVRMGDEVSFTASLMNLTEKEIKGKVRMELFNPKTEKVWMAQKKSFRVLGNGSDTVRFSFKVKDEYEVLACRMVAEGGGFSDGEQRYLPVLSDKQWITESVSIDVDQAGTYRIPLAELFNHHSPTVIHPRMIVEFTGNPVWYAVQALPVLAEPANDNAFSWAAAYYANKLAGYIVQFNPKIRQVVENWKMLEKDMSSSPLQKNEELKDLLLEETPWLSDAMDETEQRRQLVTLFDSNTMNYRNLISVNKLKELQNENGSWSWYKGMPGNRYMTTQIVELLARLQTMVPQTNHNQEMMAVYRKAFDFLKKQVRKEYDRMREMEREQILLPSEQTLRYLYICALDASLQPEKMVNEYFIRLLETQSAQLTIYGKSLAAIVLLHSGNRERADEFLRSVMEYSVVSEEMGRYFDTAKAPVSWFSYQIPTEVVALEAISQLRKDENTVEQMKRWLLKQKQTQGWNMPIATVDAVYALLMNGSDWLDQTPSAELVLGEETVPVPNQQTLNYVKQEVRGNVMSIEDVEIRKATNGMAWGAVYTQFLENVDKIEVLSNGLSVSRSLWKDGTPVSSDALGVGDRITVRLTVSADRNMDFVQLKDERASCMEPVDVLSSYRWKNGIGYYQVTKDASTCFFFDQLRKGTHVLEYDVFITAEGEYQQGIASVQSVYAPEFEGHSATQRLHVK